MLKRVVFLDRDGVINEDSPDYVKRWEEFHFIPKSLEAIAALCAEGMTLFVITNQSAIRRGLMTLSSLEALHQKMLQIVRTHGGEIRDIFFCPHVPEDGCRCRKPEPGMLFTAQRRYDIDLSRAFMVGDSETDVTCARAAGCGHALLVRTGKGAAAEKHLKEKGQDVDHIAPDLYGAAEWILNQQLMNS